MNYLKAYVFLHDAIVNCQSCPFYNGDYCQMDAISRDFSCYTTYPDLERPEFCPLRELF